MRAVPTVQVAVINTNTIRPPTCTAAYMTLLVGRKVQCRAMSTKLCNQMAACSDNNIKVWFIIRINN